VIDVWDGGWPYVTVRLLLTVCVGYAVMSSDSFAMSTRVELLADWFVGV
jgi:hypothetical protein